MSAQKVKPREAAVPPNVPLEPRLTSEARRLSSGFPAPETLHKAVDVSKDPEITDEVAFEGKNRHSIPPDVTPSRFDFKQLLPVVAMKSELGENVVALFGDGKDVRGVLAERAGDEPDVADKLLMTDEGRPQRAAECKVWMEDRGNEGNIRLIPHLLVEDTD